jgi:hypothetical protein
MDKFSLWRIESRGAKKLSLKLEIENQNALLWSPRAKVVTVSYVYSEARTYDNNCRISMTGMVATAFVPINQPKKISERNSFNSNDLKNCFSIRHGLARRSLYILAKKKNKAPVSG